MISDKYECIFIHIPKNAGTSIETKNCEEENTINLLPDHRTIIDLEPCSLKKIACFYKTDQSYSILRRLKYYIQKDKLGNYYRASSKKRYNNYFKFSIVRNPWSRAYSWFKNVMNDANHQIKFNVPSDCSFHDFILYYLDNNTPLRSQLYWLKDSSSKIPMDFIGKFENLKNDFSKIAKLLI